MPSIGLVIAGFHRSGTSLTAAACRISGLSLGQDLYPPHLSNRDGHFEDRAFVEINEAYLAWSQCSWQADSVLEPFQSASVLNAMRAYTDRRGQEGQWAAKDPRAGLTAREWYSAANGAVRFLVPVRPADHCAGSLRLRHSQMLALGAKGLAAEQATSLWRDGDLPFRMWSAHHESLKSAGGHGVPIQFVDHRVLRLGDYSFLNPLDVKALETNPPLRDFPEAPPTSTGLSPDTRRRLESVGQSMAEIPSLAACLDLPAAMEEATEEATYRNLVSTIRRLPFSTEDSLIVTSVRDVQPLAEVRLLAEQGRLHAALSGLKAEGPTITNPVPARLLRARIEMRLGLWSEAAEVLRTVIVDAPNEPQALLGLAECSLALGRLDEAEATLEVLLAVQAGAPWVWARASSSVRRLNRPGFSSRFEEAMWKAISAREPAAAGVLAEWEMRRDNDECLEKASDLLAAAAPGGSLDPAFQRAHIELYLRRREYDRAWLLEVKQCLANHSVRSYLTHLDSCLGQIGEPALRLDLLVRWLRTVERFESSLMGAAL